MARRREIIFKKTLRDYLSGLRGCEDFQGELEQVVSNKLFYEFGIENNYLIELYGAEENKLFEKVTKALKESPQKNGINEKWNLRREVQEPDGRTFMSFYYDLGTVEIQTRNSSSGIKTHEILDGKKSIIHMIFFPTQVDKKIEGASWYKAMAKAIEGIGDYILREELTARYYRKTTFSSYEGNEWEDYWREIEWTNIPE